MQSLCFDAIPHQVESGERVLILYYLGAVGRYPQIKPQIDVRIYILRFPDRQSPDITIPSLDVTGITIVDLKKIVPTDTKKISKNRSPN